MRILVVSNLFPPVAVGGYEMICAGVVAELRPRHEILVLTSRCGRRRTDDEEGVWRALPLIPGTTRGTLTAPLGAIDAAKTMRRALASFRPELIYIWNGSQIPHAVVAIAGQSGVPLAFNVGEHWFSRLFTGDQFLRYMTGGRPRAELGWVHLVRQVNRHPALRLDLTVRLRAAVMWGSGALRRLSPPPPSVAPVIDRVLYPVTPQTAYFATLERAPSRLPVVAFVGRVEPQKGPHVAYQALAELRRTYGLDVRLVLAGPCDSVTRKRLDALARKLGIEADVELRGQLDRDDLGRLLQSAHAMVVPSIWDEPAGAVLIEAAAARLPVVASRSGGMPEILRDGQEALFFAKGDASACAAALAQTLNDPRATEARVQRASARAAELSFERYVAENERFLADTAWALRVVEAPAPAGA